MSLIDPNQIISLAPSQNVGQPTVPFAPGSATAAVYDRDLDQDVAGSIMQAGTYDPTAAAKAIRLSQETRIPFPLAQNNYDDLAHRQKITVWQQTVSQNPTLAPLLRDPEFAAVAQDDSQNVGWWTRFKSSVADLNKAREDWWFETTKDIATGGMIGFRVAQRGQVGARMMDSEITPEDRETIRKADADLKAFQRPASFLGSAAELIGQQVVTVPEALREAAVGATAGGLAGAIGGPLAPATMAGGVALGATAGLATGFARQAYRVEAGNAYVDMIDKGVEPDTAYPVAMGIGLVNASLELGGASFVAKPFQQAFRLAAKNAINEAIIQPTTRQALRAAGASYVKAIGAETSTEVMQEVVTMVGEEAAMLASGIDSELTAADAAKRVVDTAIHTAMGMAVLGVPGAGVTLYSGMRASARTQREQNALTQIAQNAKDTKFRADASTVYERLAASQLNGTSAETTYIDAERVKEVLDQAGLTPAEIDQVLPGVRQQLPDALASRGDVTIPTAKWAANTVGTKIEAALLPHMRLSATSMSPVEAAAFQAEREQLVAEASQILEQKQAVDAEWTRQAKDIADTIRQQAVAVRGMTETDADVFASGVQAFYVTKAVEMGMTPEQLFRLAPYTIQGEAAGVSLEQANRNIIASVDAELGNIMEAAREASRAAGKTKSRDTQAAAFKAKQDWIAANSVRYAEYQSAQRMESLENERIREAAASALAGKIDESLAAAAKTLMDAGFVLDYESPAPSKSKYYRKGNVLIRLSDHDIPVTPERAAARAAGVQVPYRDFVFEGTEIDAELLRDLETAAARTMPGIMEQAAVPSAIDAQHREAIKAGDIATAQALTDAAAETRMPDSQVRDEAGKILRVFHGTQRIDRVGNRLLKKRATSGPMPFFTNTRPIAEGYAQGKQDTSIEDIGYEQWFKYKPKGSRSRVTLDQAWLYLTPEQRATATERLFTVGYQNPDDGTGPIVANTDTIASRDHVQYLLREARGNALTAAKELWLNSGSLFNDEQQFMDVLNGMGLTEGFVYDSPHAVNSGIIEAYLNITNPLDTAAIPESVVAALQQRANRIRKPAAQYGRDHWDKAVRDPQSWMDTLRTDIAEGTTTAWTSIPDWVTDVLRGLGYDGIKDMGGKFGGEQHTVWIPFEPEQVKFADAIAKDASGRLIPLSERFDVTSPMMYFQSPVTPGFYSALEREVNAIDAKALPASGWSERFKGLISKGAIKADELEWSGLADYLKMQEGKVSKDTVLEFLRGNGVRVERVTMGGPPSNIDELRNALARAEMAHEEALEMETAADRGDDEAAAIAATEAANQTRRAVVRAKMALDDAERATETKYERYTLPGGRNYREVLLTLPVDVNREAEEQDRATATLIAERDSIQDAINQSAGPTERAELERWLRNTNIRIDFALKARPELGARTAFKSSHWDQPNVLVHLRMNDRVDADGKRVLFVEEVQSDWGQAGVKYGFVNQRAADEAELANLLMQQETKPSDALKKQIARVQARIKRGEYNVFRAPYVETTDGWLNLGLKQVLLEAVRGNYDRVAFVTGQQSADRYDLSKQVSRVYLSNMVFDGETDQLARATIVVTGRNGIDLITEKQATPARIEELIGKEAAQRLISSPSITTNAGTPQQVNVLEGDGLKVGGEGMKSFYDKIVPDAVNKLLKKYGGGKIGTVEIDTRTPESEAYYAELTDADILPQPGFDITPEMVTKLESGLPLFQAAAASGPRGGFDPRTLTTFINKGGDLSTWIHETAHFHFTVLGRLASRADAPESIRADMDTLLQWGKVDGATPEERLATWNAMTVDQQRKLHEQFAYSWEVYQFEGKAPSVEMQGVFERFRMWLMRVYKSVLEINAVYRSQFGEDLPALTPEVRQVMDRMLATQEQIERQQAINQMIPSFQSQDESGMSDAEWAAYQKMQAEATEAAVTDLGKASLSQMEWLSGARSRLLKQMQTRNARARREMRDEVSRQVRSDPTYRALRYIRTGKIEGPDGAEIVVDGPHKLSTAGVREIIDALPMDRLIDLNMLPEGVMAENGRDPDLVAADFGFDSGDALLRAMVGMRSLEDEINARTDARLLAENALMSPEQMEEEVQRAIHNEARARFVAVEQRWLERLDRPARIILEAAKQAARAKVAGTLVRDLRPQQWIAAESRAARDARLAYSNRRTPEEIGRSVYTRVYNEQEAAGTGLVEAQVIAEAARVKAVADAQARLDAFRAAYPEADPAAIAIRAKRAQTYNNQMAAQTLEAKAEIGKAVVYLRRVLRAENRKKMGADYADQIEGILERFDLAAISTEKARARQALAEWLEGERKKGLDPELPPVIADEAERKPYKNMTVAEFRELADAVRTLEYMGKNTTKILLAGKRLEFEATRDRIVENGEENAERRGRKAKPPVSVPTKLQRRIEAIRGYHAAQLTPSAIIQTIDGGEDGPLSRYLLEPFAEQANFQTEQRVRATEFLDKTLRPIIKSPRNRPIVIDSIGRSMQLEERLVVALNYGNDGNAKRLLVGEDWTEAQVADILATLTKAELEAVQKIWDFFETFRPMISAKERRLTGKDLEYVDRRELTVPRTADGQSVTLPGGYYPIRYDPRRSTMVQAIDEVEEAKRMMDGARTASTTSDTFKKKRSQNGLGKPLTLTMNALYSGVNEVIDDLSWQEWLIAANRLMRDGKFATMVRERYGDAYYQQLREWISTVAVGDRVASSVVENMAVAVRQNVSVSAMAWRAVTAGIQITGIFPAAAKIGTINTLRGLTYLMTSPRQASERAREKSKFMANRGRTRYRDLNEIRNLVRGETGIRRNYMATAYAAIGAMQSISDNTTWWGRYESAKRDGRDEDTAVFLADQAVKDTQGSGLTGDLSSVMRGGKAQSPYVKLFTSFMQYSNTMYSLTSERAMTANGRGDQAARLFLILIPGAILEELIRNLLTAKAEEDEPEELVRRLAANQLDYLIGLPFGIRELTGIGDVLLGVEPRYQYRGPSGLRAISATGQLVNELSQGEFDAGLRRALINFVGITTGAPSTQINATIDGINAVMEGEAEGADVILAPIAGFKTR